MDALPHYTLHFFPPTYEEGYCIAAYTAKPRPFVYKGCVPCIRGQTGLRYPKERLAEERVHISSSNCAALIFALLFLYFSYTRVTQL